MQDNSIDLRNAYVNNSVEALNVSIDYFSVSFAILIEFQLLKVSCRFAIFVLFLLKDQPCLNGEDAEDASSVINCVTTEDDEFLTMCGTNEALKVRNSS